MEQVYMRGQSYLLFVQASWDCNVVKDREVKHKFTEPHSTSVWTHRHWQTHATHGDYNMYYTYTHTIHLSIVLIQLSKFKVATVGCTSTVSKCGWLTAILGCHEVDPQQVIGARKSAGVHLAELQSLGPQELLEHHPVLAVLSSRHSYTQRIESLWEREYMTRGCKWQSLCAGNDDVHTEGISPQMTLLGYPGSLCLVECCWPKAWWPLVKGLGQWLYLSSNPFAPMCFFVNQLLISSDAQQQLTQDRQGITLTSQAQASSLQPASPGLWGECVQDGGGQLCGPQASLHASSLWEDLWVRCRASPDQTVLAYSGHGHLQRHPTGWDCHSGVHWTSSKPRSYLKPGPLRHLPETEPGCSWAHGTCP